MISDFERNSSNAYVSSFEWFVLLVLWFLKQAMILFLSDLSDRSVGASEGGAILVSVSLNLGVRTNCFMGELTEGVLAPSVSVS